ncbi:MAG: DUF3093 domain-containing protein [Microbacteriaceae bacterium]|nr:DUF3093 domain-containing protein [Microbacteriaceae bacterium]MCL2795348.1 DUF3093 domain-containing protein [Microbacteriaceae bacterium]
MTLFRERLYAAPWLFVATALIIPATLAVFWPINSTVGVILAIVLYAVIVALLVGFSPVLVVTAEEFRAGRANVEREFIGRAQAFTGSEAALERGQHLDARAWLLLRGSLPVVKVPILDAADPVPYWVVSTRRPHELAAALNGAAEQPAA